MDYALRDFFQVKAHFESFHKRIDKIQPRNCEPNLS